MCWDVRLLTHSSCNMRGKAGRAGVLPHQLHGYWHFESIDSLGNYWAKIIYRAPRNSWNNLPRIVDQMNKNALLKKTTIHFPALYIFQKGVYNCCLNCFCCSWRSAFWIQTEIGWGTASLSNEHLLRTFKELFNGFEEA
jgi:hypothetical protein